MYDRQARKFRGRPLDPNKGETILAATRAAVASRGYEGTSMDEVARLARTSKLTLYRRFPTKASLVLAMIRAMAQMRGVPAGASDLRSGLIAQLEFFESENKRLDAIPILGAALTEQVRVPLLIVAFREHFLTPRVGLLRDAVETARRAGLPIRGESLDVAYRLAADFYFNQISGGKSPNWPDDAVGRMLAGN